MAFTPDNTEGYTQEELGALNRELDDVLNEIEEDDLDARYAAEKAFADEVARR
jgi:hypothetical protein